MRKQTDLPKRGLNYAPDTETSKLKHSWHPFTKGKCSKCGPSDGIINRITPAQASTPQTRFKDSDRKTFSRLIQFRTGHAHIGEYYRRFIRTEDPACPCRHPVQTRRHILKECPRFFNHRTLLGTGRNTQLERLVGTEKGIKRLMKFITSTKAIDKHNPTRTGNQNQNPNSGPIEEDRQGEG